MHRRYLPEGTLATGESIARYTFWHTLLVGVGISLAVLLGTISAGAWPDGVKSELIWFDLPSLVGLGIIILLTKIPPRRGPPRRD
ncbi:MAG: hypothetical protein HY556_04635 [Euryarchaeota archaeon]|nr:hypothetical protein [Euryarchaeota archaeon]